jgi:hypothetical protein
MKFSKLLSTTLCLLGALSASAFAQQVTTEIFGPCTGQDTITFTGSVHVSTTVDTTQNTVDYHINLLSVKRTGTLVSKYVASGATDLLDQGFPRSEHNSPDSDQCKSVPHRPMPRRIPHQSHIPSRRNRQLRLGFHLQHGDGQRWYNVEPNFPGVC